MEMVMTAASAGQAFFQQGGLQPLISSAGGVDMLSSGATALQALQLFSAGLADRNEALADADRFRLGGNQAILQGKQSGNEILDRMVDTLAKNRVIMAASGVSAGVGTPAAVQRDIRRRGERAIGIVQNDAAIEWFTKRQMADASRARGKAYGLGGLISAGATLALGAAESARRG